MGLSRNAENRCRRDAKTVWKTTRQNLPGRNFYSSDLHWCMHLIGASLPHTVKSKVRISNGILSESRVLRWNIVRKLSEWPTTAFTRVTNIKGLNLRYLQREKTAFAISWNFGISSDVRSSLLSIQSRVDLWDHRSSVCWKWVLNSKFTGATSFISISVFIFISKNVLMEKLYFY